MAAVIESSRYQEVKAADLNKPFPRFRTSRQILLEKDGRVHKGRRKISLRKRTVGEVVSSQIDKNVAGVKMPGKGVIWMHGSTLTAPRHEITATTLDRTSHNFPYDPVRDKVTNITANQLTQDIKDRMSY